MFIDNKTVLFLLMPMIPFRGCMSSDRVTDSYVKKYETKHLTKLQNEKMEGKIKVLKIGLMRRS